MTTRAVLFDWRGTLVVPPTLEQWVEDGLRRTGRDSAGEDVQVLVERIVASSGPEDRLDAPGIDADALLHWRMFQEVLTDAGIDAALVDALYASESDHTRNLFASDAAPTIRALKSAGLCVGVVSDIHFDIRPAFAEAGLATSIDAYSLSFEIGVQKPDPAIFAHALETLGVAAAEAIMVGDRSRPDGGAVEVGIPTLLLPPLASASDERLGLVLDLVL